MTTVSYLVDVDLGSVAKITNAVDGSSAQDYVTLAQLQAMVRGLDWKQSVRAASTANVSISSPGTTLDGVSLANPNDILLKDQTAPAENGIYTWTASGSALVRRSDADASVEVTPGMTVQVEEGTANADKWYYLSTNGPITLGTTGLVFTNIGSGTTGFTVAGAGLASSGGGTTVDLNVGNGLAISSDTAIIDTAIVPQKAKADIGDGSSTSYTVTHGLNNAYCNVQVKRKASPFDIVYARVEQDTATPNACIVRFNTAPSTNQYTVIISG